MSIRVLIADDAPFIREVLRGTLDGSEFEVVGEAHNGEEAIRLYEELMPDVVLMDIIMPQKTGIEATKEIIALYPGAKIVACSTVDDDQMVSRALEAGCLKYVTKPFEKKDLVSALMSVAES